MPLTTDTISKCVEGGGGIPKCNRIFLYYTFFNKMLKEFNNNIGEVFEKTTHAIAVLVVEGGGAEYPQ